MKRARFKKSLNGVSGKWMKQGKESMHSGNLRLLIFT